MNDDDESKLRKLLARAQPIVVWAKLRTTGEGTDDMTLRIQHGSDPATPENLERLSRRLPGGANRGGRTSARDERLERYRTAIRALADKGYDVSAITASEILKAIHRTGDESHLYADLSPEGGLKRFRVEVLRAR